MRRVLHEGRTAQPLRGMAIGGRARAAHLALAKYPPGTSRSAAAFMTEEEQAAAAAAPASSEISVDAA
ncbi:MAG: hypothetical protein U1F58_13685 [Burkholderiales bacterium]